MAYSIQLLLRAGMSPCGFGVPAGLSGSCSGTGSESSRVGSVPADVVAGDVTGVWIIPAVGCFQFVFKMFFHLSSFATAS